MFETAELGQKVPKEEKPVEMVSRTRIIVFALLPEQLTPGEITFFAREISGLPPIRFFQYDLDYMEGEAPAEGAEEAAPGEMVIENPSFRQQNLEVRDLRVVRQPDGSATLTATIHNHGEIEVANVEYIVQCLNAKGPDDPNVKTVHRMVARVESLVAGEAHAVSIAQKDVPDFNSVRFRLRYESKRGE